MMNSLARSVVPGRCPVLRHFLFCAALALVGGLFTASAQAQFNAANGSGAELAFRDAAVSAPPGSQGRQFKLGRDYPTRLPPECPDCTWLQVKMPGNFAPNIPATPMPAEAWNQGPWAEYIGRILEETTVYVLQVPVDGRATVKTTIFAVRPGDPDPGANPQPGGPSTSSKWAVWAGLGAAIPRGDLADTNKRGSAVALGFEYTLNNKTSIEATLAGNSNDGKGASADINVTQLGVNGKFYFNAAPLRVFVTAGVEAYAFDPGSTRFGGSLGAGLQYRFASKWSLEGRLTQHGLTDNPPPTTPPTFLVALRYAF